MKRYSVLAAIVVSALLWYLGTGLHPLPGSVFLAPLPVLLVAPRVGAAAAFFAGFLAWGGSGLRYWPYFIDTIEQPVLVTLLLLGGTAAVFGGLVVMTRALVLRGRTGSAVLALPTGWVTFEFLVSLAGQFGAWWSIAYTQFELLPLIQTAALTGPWGITFLIMLVPATVAALAAPEVTGAQRLRFASATVLLLVAVGAFGWWRLAVAPERDTVRVGLLAVSQPPEYVPANSADGRDMVARVVSEIDRLADQGAQVVVLPEKAWTADESTLAALSGPLTEVATRRGIQVVAGLVKTTGGISVNAAIAYPSGVEYAKHRLIPGLEDDLEPGTGWQRIPGEPWALAVCFDLDGPDLVRENRNRGATLLLVPALDFTNDRWLHSRMAVMRGVESGVGIARAPQLGELVASDSRGHILASARTDVTVTRSVLATIPLDSHKTVYARFGDWFAWLSVAVFAASAMGSFRRRSRLQRRPTTNSIRRPRTQV
ncbi:nitrilase-related carbon-nitrogen hydrolase [Nocardia pseudovaccinii]|uniref:nitrilase-related carbon-nitrogen hydrolase n=1 Tax=Nocardia pseudovaccinii TaxID=189540 RepID=UPI000A9D7548|nr:nitrilase-related carbon-nitrogen hydrolase [Nocardia pseudovaccinii]